MAPDTPCEAYSGLGSVGAAAEDGPPRRERLRGPLPAFPRLRRLFDPQSGWFRLLERDVSHLLSAHIYPLLPGIGIPYAMLLRRSLTVREADVTIDDLPREFEGVTVLLVTDLHVGPFLPPRALQLAFSRLMTLAPDLILLGGDLTTSRLPEIIPHLPAFGSLHAPLGVFAVLGNHDHYTGQTIRLREVLETNGVRVLHNASVVLERGQGKLVLAGIDDLYQGKPDLDAALADATGLLRSPEREASFTSSDGVAARETSAAGGPTILLSHNPDIFFQASERGVSLVLAGHTHGGQIRIPGLPVLVRQSRYRLDEGRYAVPGCELIVSRGLGASGLPLRVACPPEAVLVRLRRREDVLS